MGAIVPWRAPQGNAASVVHRSVLVVNVRSPYNESIPVREYAMSPFTASRQISRELAFINEAIDRKIIKGLPYAQEARRHKELLKLFKALSRERGFGFSLSRLIFS
jgi:hypothetical protein